MQLTTAESQKLLAEKAEMERIIGISPAILYRHVWDAALEQFVNAYVSPVITSLFGYEQDVFRNVNWWREHVHPDDLPLVKASTRQLFEAGEADYAFRFAVWSGQYVWIQDSPRLQKNAAGEPVEIIGSCMDISATKQAVKECKQCGLRYRSLFEDALDMIHIVDADGRIVDANRAELTTMGYSRDAYIGKPLSDFVLPECRDASMASLKAVFTGDVAQYETSLRTKHGERIDVEVYATPYREEGRVVHARAIIRNITERKQAETALADSENRLLEAQSVARFGHYLYDVRQDAWTCSKELDHIFGTDDSTVKNLSIWQEVVHPDHREMMLSYFQHDVLARRKAFDKEYKIINLATGQVKWVHGLGRLKFDSHGEPVEMFGTIHDITGRKQAEEKLRRKEVEYKALYAMHRRMCDNMPDMIWAKDMDNRYIFANKALCDNLLHANDTDEPIGKTDMFFADRERATHPDDPQWHTFGEVCRDSDRLTLERGKTGQFDEFGNIRGQFLRLDVHKAPMYDEHGKVIGVVGCGRDVTALREVEKHLLKLSTAIEHAGESMIITDRNGVIEYVNPAFTKLTGYSSDEVIGRKPSILNSGYQDSAFYASLWDTILGGNTWQGKIIDRKKDGGFYPTTLTISPIYDEDGVTSHFSHFVGIQSDLSRIEELESQFHQAQKMEAIGTLVGGIAHDFNNMLAGMTGNVFLARQRAQGMPLVQQNIANIEQLCYRAADMIQQLLTFARKSMVRMKAMPLSPFFKETLKLLRVSVPENIAMVQDICCDTLRITGDSTQLHQVLMNLITNACDALEGVDDPCICITLEAWHASEAFLESHADITNGPYAHLSVQDNGCGIPENQIEHLFEPFFTTKEVGKGTGLGLAMVYGAVKTHAGFVEVDSVAGEGSTFHIYLPLLEPEVVAAASLQDDVLVYGHGETILLADDEQHIIDTGKDVLEVLGYQVITAVDGRQAVDRFEAHSEEIDLCIFDVVMPVMGGNQAAKSIRQRHPEAKIIFATGYDKHLLQDMENEEVLTKPFAIEEMSRLIKKQLHS